MCLCQWSQEHLGVMGTESCNQNGISALNIDGMRSAIRLCASASLAYICAWHLTTRPEEKARLNSNIAP